MTSDKNSSSKVGPGLNIDLLQHIQTAVLLLDPALCIGYMNEAAESLFKVSLGQMRGEPFTSLIYPGTSKSADTPLMAELKQTLVNLQPFTQREATLEVFGAGTLTADYYVTPLLNEGSNLAPTNLLLEFLPIDRKLSIGREEERLNSQETTRMLVRGLAHEVKNPLGGIRGSAQLLESELSDPQLKEYTRVVIAEADRLRNLVDRLLGPNKPPQLSPTNIHRVLEHVSRVSLAELSDPPTVVREYDPSIPKLDGDYDQLVQAFMNVLQNALQALQEQERKPVTQSSPLTHRQVTLRTQTLRRFTIGDINHRLVVRVDIEDNGPGIAKEIDDRLFYPMISGRAGGSGLGLSITQTIIGQHNGLIAVKSQPGCTRFSFYLPLKQRPEHGGSVTHTPAKEPSKQ